MITHFLLKLRILPRWIIILIDIAVVGCATYLAYLLRFNFEVKELENFNYHLGMGVNMLASLLALLVTRSYAGIVRYTGIQDMLRVFNTLVITHVTTCVVNLVYHYNYNKNLIPYSVILIAFLASFLLLLQYRLLIKNVFSYYRGSTMSKIRVLVFGAGQLGMVTKQVIDGTDGSKYRVVGFVEDDIRKVGKNIHGTPIYSGQELNSLLDLLSVKELIIAVKDLSVDRKNEIVDICLEQDVKVRTVPQADDWVKGELSLNQIKEINIEDLLGRESIQLDNMAVCDQLQNKRVCITGAAGSIGSELVRQVIQYRPEQLIVIDQAESALYEIERELGNNDNIEFLVADVTNEGRIDDIFSHYKPEIIFHAAAYKHVPLMEKNPSEAVLCNVIGTRNLADFAVKHHVSKFVMISTDKAVNPTNVMGCSKRIAEIYVRSLNNHLKQLDRTTATSFVTTRFGNVLGSNGSVIPFFQKQISQGGPVTVTHPEITRYFMTITEACQLVLEAGAMGKGGEIFIFDMGKSIKIVDLAKKMIQLSGLALNKDIEIVYTGLRQGEKLYEELLASKENTISTHHSKIMIAKVLEYDYDEIKKNTEDLHQAALDRKDNFEIVAIMKRIVPEFKSNSSPYQVLDNSSSVA
ncbi:UDP-N-acetylglucosamine 4,6-dehydratase [Fulvivirga imtechensis AK7]|uniref:UDP-N-acetylglucosamine 4,6-dehydratase n=1 Tax=Fulvivirga imtechensis AK7 TaxID=1237149 RepID=L8JTF7_9BACT|nr:nucleoside-diphosphate sugar epimerase/dehydratase [Fulvivirga imtechensis]ELR70622.1 UDP-N-acetylglucosamine 4,6-dehydratase [Fulvivirga imtechensis AK7]